MLSNYSIFSGSYGILVQELAAELGVEYIETSAATGEGVGKAVHKLLDLVMYRIETKCQVHKLIYLVMYSLEIRISSERKVSQKCETFSRK